MFRVSVDIRVSGLYICVCLEYLMTLGDFFTKAQPEPAPVKASPQQQQQKPSQQSTDTAEGAVQPKTASSQQGTLFIAYIIPLPVDYYVIANAISVTGMWESLMSARFNYFYPKTTNMQY